MSAGPSRQRRIAAGYTWLSTVPRVPITPIRRFRVACAAARAPGPITSITGRPADWLTASNALELAVLHAMMIILTCCSSKKRAFCSENLVTVSADLLPYGARPESPK